MRKQIVSLLVATMLTTMTPGFAFASDFSDMPINWSKEALESAVTNGLLKGENGKIQPKETLTRAQMGTIVNRAFGATEKASLLKFTDINASSWYYDELAKSVEMQTFIGTGNTLNPNSNITREEAFLVLARAFKLSSTNMAVLDQFADKNAISKWAQSSVAALVSAGYIDGSNGQIYPKQNMTRAEFAQIMNNLVGTYIQKSGTYTTDINGSLMVNTPDVILKDMTITGNLIVGDGVGNGEVTLNNVVVKGTTIIRGGGIHSIKIIGKSSLTNIIVARVNGEVRVYAEDGTQVGDIVVDGQDDVIVEGKVGVVTVAASNITVTANNAEIESASLDGNNSKIVLNTNTLVKTITLNAQNSEVVAEKGAEIKKVVANEDGARISGTGTVGEVNANANNITVKTNGTSVAAGQGTTGVVAGTTNVTSGTTTKVSAGTSTQTAAGGSSGGSSSSTIAVTGITVTGTGGAISLVNGASLQMMATVTPTNATNQTVVWSVVNGTGGATIDSKGLLTANGAGTVIAKATNTASNIVGQLTVTVEPTLAEMKTNAKTAVGAAFNSYTVTDYTPTNWTALTTAKTNGDTAVDAAIDAVGVNSAKLAAISAMGGVKTIAGTLADAKITAKAELVAALATYTKTDYTPANWGVLTTAKTNGDTAIAAAMDLVEVDSAKTTTINTMDAVKTIAETTAEVIATAIAEINGANASSMNAVLVSNAAILGLDMTDYDALGDKSSVITAMVALSGADKATILSTFNNAVATQKAAEALATAKTAAKAALNTALAGYVELDYTPANWTALTTAKTNGDTAIDATSDAAGVNSAKVAAISEMGSVKTIAQTLADAKITAKADLVAALATYTETAYTPVNWGTLTTAKTNGDTAVAAAMDLVEVDSAKTTAINTMDAVKTIAETTAEAIATAIAEINGANPSSMNAVLVSNAAILGLDMNDYDALGDKSSVITAMVALSGADKATILSIFNNAVAAQKAAEALAAAEVAAVLAINGADASSMNSVLQSNAVTIGLDLTDYSALLDKSSVITAMVALNGADKVIILSTFNNAVTTQKTAEALAATKAAAKTALNIALAGYVELDYTPANWIVLTTAKTDGDTTIEAATDVAGVNSAKTAAINAMDTVKTIAETLAEAKVVAKSDLTAALGTYVVADYTTENWTNLTTAKTDGDTAIDAATDLAGVSSAKTAAINAMGAVKPNAQIAAEAEAAAVTAINGADASSMDAAIKANATTLGLDLTVYNSLANKNSVITAMVALNGADKSVVVSTFNSAVDAQKALETTITSKSITNFNYETIYAEQARLTSKPISSVNFASNPKQFTVSDGTHTININLNWDIPLSGFTTGQMMGSAVDSFIQDYCNANHIDLGSRTMGSVGYGDTFSIYTFSTGTSAKITLGGSNWSDFFTVSQSTGKNDDFSANRSFTISDGINSTNIMLEWDDSDMDGLISDINSQMGSVLARAEKVSESQFKIVAKNGAHTITISGTNKDEFF